MTDRTRSTAPRPMGGEDDDAPTSPLPARPDVADQDWAHPLTTGPTLGRAAGRGAGRAAREARLPGLGRGWLLGAAAVALVAVTSLATAVVVLSHRAAVAPAAASAAPTPARAATSPTTASSAVIDPGPELLEATGNPVDADTAEQIRDVYRALTANDSGSIRVAFGAAGSDDATDSESHLADPQVRAQLLAAMRTPPTQPDTTTYSYARAGYSLTFSAGIDGDTHAGLDEINGPWAPTTAARAATGRASNTAAAGSSRCAAGTRPEPTDGYPCTDIATGIGVNNDGTAGVQGLKPCPPDAIAPSDPNLPTRNPHTGAVCAPM